MYLTMNELVKKFSEKEIEREDLVVALAAFDAKEVEKTSFDDDVKKEAAELREELDSGNKMTML